MIIWDTWGVTKNPVYSFNSEQKNISFKTRNRINDPNSVDVGLTPAALLQKASADGITVLEAKKTPNPIQQMQNLMGEIGENLPKLTNEQQDELKKVMKGAFVGAAAAAAIGLGIRSLMTNSSNPSVPTQTTLPQDFNITDQGLFKNPFPNPSNKTPFGSSTTPPADQQVPPRLTPEIPKLENLENIEINKTLTPPRLTPEEVNDGLGGVYKALITPKGDPGSWNMKIDYVPGHADISEDMRKLALNMAAGGMAQKLQDTEQHKNAAGNTITALKRIAEKTGVEEKKILEAYATAASNAAKDITCLVPNSYGVVYNTVREVNLWEVYCMLMPRRRRESEKKYKTLKRAS
ncbi:MAG: hypothetical protein ACK5UY_00835, partial [Holosporales bacterium]